MVDLNIYNLYNSRLRASKHGGLGGRSAAQVPRSTRCHKRVPAETITTSSPISNSQSQPAATSATATCCDSTSHLASSPTAWQRTEGLKAPQLHSCLVQKSHAFNRKIAETLKLGSKAMLGLVELVVAWNRDDSRSQIKDSS